MRVRQCHRENGRWTPEPPRPSPASLVLVFGSGAASTQTAIDEISAAFPSAYVTGCSTAGEIRGDAVADDTIVATAIDLEWSRCVGASIDLRDAGSSADAGRMFAAKLPSHDEGRTCST